MRTKDNFVAELEAVRSELAKRGRSEQHNPSLSTDECGIKCDFELPYSSMPQIRSDRWLKS